MILFDAIALTRDNKCLFSNLTFKVEKNQKRRIKGKSGTGKTTLFKLIMGFETPDSGRICVNTLPIEQGHIKTIRSQIFYLSQDIDLRKGIVSEFINEILSAHDRQPEQSQFNRWLSFLELEPAVLDQESTALSGGERQRVGLLIGFLLDRPIWLLDEPTSALDEEMKTKIVTQLWSMNTTMLIISHDEIWPENNTILITKG